MMGNGNKIKVNCDLTDKLKISGKIDLYILLHEIES